MRILKTYSAGLIAVHMVVEVLSEDMYQMDQRTVSRGWRKRQRERSQSQTMVLLTSLLHCPLVMQTVAGWRIRMASLS